MEINLLPIELYIGWLEFYAHVESISMTASFQ